MDPLSRFCIHSPHVVREYFDSEVVVVNLESGTYYSLENVSARIWALLDGGATVEQITSHLVKATGESTDTIHASVDRFLTNLLDEGLIVSCSTSPLPPDAARQFLAKIADAQLSFQIPALKKYTDMQDLLLLDPVHDVDEAGWPIPQPEDR